MGTTLKDKGAAAIRCRHPRGHANERSAMTAMGGGIRLKKLKETIEAAL